MPTFRTYDELITFAGPKSDRSIREELRDFIENVSAVDRPLLARFRKTRVTSHYPEWLSDVLPARTTNAWAEGVDHTSIGLTGPTRTTNAVQIFADFGQLSDLRIHVESAGTDDVFLYHEGKSVKKVLNDMEHAIHRGSMITGASGTNDARQMTGMLNAISTNATDSSGTTLTEDVFNDFIQVFVDGGTDIRPNFCCVNSFGKRTISQYNTAITRNIEADARRQLLVVNQYESDFGSVDVFYSRDQLNSSSRTTQGVSVLLGDDRYFEIGFLQSLMSERLARTGLSEKYQISAEMTLIHRTELAGSVATSYVPYIPAAT